MDKYITPVLKAHLLVKVEYYINTKYLLQQFMNNLYLMFKKCFYS